MRRLLMLALLIVSAAAPAAAQSDITGEWAPLFHEDQPDRVPGIGPADFAGLPLTDGARQWALSWDASRVSVLEHQCQVHVLPYILSGPTRLRISAQQDGNTERIVAFQQYIGLWGQQRTIWVDGRRHPPEIAPHSWMGFSTGVWEGNTLVVRTTHIKQGWVRRNGVPQSDEVVTTERFTRHGDVLTYVIHIKDPIYLTEPLVRSRNFVRMSGLGEGNWIAATPCEPAEETTAPPHSVPNYLPGENPFVAEAERRTGLPADALAGGAETLYPEYRRKLAELRKGLK
ncbi:MAG TPA: hypothetical protein VNN99_16690 [Vicinamibacterales bacterium]|nr:hypothetical protein [Vicinamibacterales bacterium]